MNPPPALSVAALAKATGKTSRHIRRLAETIPGHHIKGVRNHHFHSDYRLSDWIERNKKPVVVELRAEPTGMVGGEVIAGARDFMKRLRANMARAVLTPQEQSELARIGKAIEALCRKK